MGWHDNIFPDADDPTEVGWFIGYWRILPCSKGCKQDYRLEARQFTHLVKGATREEALQELQKYVDQKRATGKLPNLKGLTLFLSKVEAIEVISDNTGAIV